MEVQEKYSKSRKNLALAGGHMYKFERYRQLGLADFNQPVGLKMNLENRWVRKSATIPWDAIEEKYAGLFPSKTGMPAKPLRILQAPHVSQECKKGLPEPGQVQKAQGKEDLQGNRAAAVYGRMVI